MRLRIKKKEARSRKQDIAELQALRYRKQLNNNNNNSIAPDGAIFFLIILIKKVAKSKRKEARGKR